MAKMTLRSVMTSTVTAELQQPTCLLMLADGGTQTNRKRSRSSPQVSQSLKSEAELGKRL